MVREGLADSAAHIEYLSAEVVVLHVVVDSNECLFDYIDFSVVVSVRVRTHV